MKQEIEATKSSSPAVTAMSVESSRAIAEVQGQILMAKQFPRNQTESRFAILEACKRPKLAETATYSYPRAGTRVEGPSIRLAEVLAQNWGNIDYGVVELEQKAPDGDRSGESVVMAYARDVQTNTRQQTVFTVPHVRYSKAQGNKPLVDPRDIYETVANAGAKRLRKCILGIIPGDILEEALDQCNKTLRGNSDEPISQRIKKMVQKFESIGATLAMIEKRIGHSIDSTTVFELVGLGKIYKSISQESSEMADWFDTKKTVDLSIKTETSKKEPEVKLESENKNDPPNDLEESNQEPGF